MPAGELHVQLWVEYADDDKILDAGEKAELLFVRAMCFMKRNKTDGKITARQLERLGLPGVKARAEKLVTVGLWESTAAGFFYPGFLKRNKSRAEIEATSEQRHEAAMLANHKRWHSDVRSDSCPFCDPTSDRYSESTESESESESGGKRGPHLCPEPFVVDDDLKVWGAERAPSVDLAVLAEKMVAWSRSKGKRHVDWRKTLQSWAIDEQKRAGPKAQARDDVDAMSRGR